MTGRGRYNPLKVEDTASVDQTLTGSVLKADVLAAGIDHGGLTGLSDVADHAYALLIDGSRALTGNWSLGGFNLTSVGNITGTDIDISAGTGDYSSTGMLDSGKHIITSTTDPQFKILNPDFSATLGGMISINSVGRLVLTTPAGGGDILLQPSLGDGTKDVIIFDDTTNPVHLLWRTAGKGNIGTSLTVGCPDNIFAKTNISAGGVFMSGMGSAADPAYTFTGGSGFEDTGMYNIGGAVLGFSTDGILRATISNTAVLLADDINFTLSGSGTVTTGTGGLDATSGNIRTTGDLNIGTGGTVLDVDSALGTVGIGTAASSGSVLNVSATLTATDDFAFINGADGLTTGAAAKSFHAIKFFLNATINHDTTSIVGVNAEVSVSSVSGDALTVDKVVGVRSDIDITKGGPGGVADLTVTDVYMFKGEAIGAIGVNAVIDNLYGLFLPDITEGTANWAIYSAGGDSFHTGDIAFGQTDKAERIGSDADGTLDLYAGTSIDFHNPNADTDLVFNFIGTTNSGVLTWNEDQDKFVFSELVQAGTATIFGIGTGNVGVGTAGTLNSITTGENNVALGLSAGTQVTEASGGIFIGYQAGDNVTTANDVIVIGTNLDAPSATVANGMNIGGILTSDDYTSSLTITKNLTIGNGAAGVDYALTFDGETNDGVITWLEDEDRFKFDDHIALELGVLYTKETTTPTAIADYGALYTKNTNELFFQDGAGTEHLLHGDAFSVIWFHGTSTVEVTISAIDTFTLIDSFTVVGKEDDLANAIGNISTNTITLSSGSGGEYKVTYHGSITATGGADKEMIFVFGITLATPKDITNVTDNTITPIVITSIAHDLDNGDMVEIVGVVGNTAANGSFIVDSKADDTFNIVALDGNATTGNGDYNEGSPTGDITIEYPGQMVVHRMVRGADLGAMSATGIHELDGNDVISLYVANVSGTTNLTVAAVSLGLDRIGD